MGEQIEMKVTGGIYNTYEENKRCIWGLGGEI